MNERSGILLAGVAHLALLAALSLSWAMTKKTLPTFAEMTPVEVVDVSDVPTVAELPKPSQEAAPQQTSEAAAPEPAPAEPPPPPPEAAKPEPPKTVSDVPPPQAKPEPKPAVKAPAKPVPEAKPTAKPVEKPTVEAKPPAKKVAPLDSQSLASLLDKKLPKAAAKPVDASRFADTIEKAIPKGAKLDARASAALQQAIQAQVAPCWNPPIGGEDAHHMTVVLHIEMSKDGRLSSTPSVVSQTGRSAANDAYSRAFAESAKRAVARCAPLKLPADLYDAWRVFELNFDPSVMTS